MPLSLW